jgi:hypothetical protein
MMTLMQKEKLIICQSTASTSLFVYRYAVVYDPSHSESEQPRFQTRVVDASGLLTIYGYTVIAKSTIPGFENM